MVPMSLLAYDRAQVEADAERIRIAEEENRIFKDLKFHTPASRAQYITFWTIQALDVYSTYRGLQYNCVREANPLLGENPGIGHMVTHKTVFLYPFHTSKLLIITTVPKPFTHCIVSLSIISFGKV